MLEISLHGCDKKYELSDVTMTMLTNFNSI